MGLFRSVPAYISPSQRVNDAYLTKRRLMKSDLLVDCDVKHETCLPGLVSDMFHILSLQNKPPKMPLNKQLITYFNVDFNIHSK